MSHWHRFWRQPTTAHRNAQIFFAVFTVGFAGAALLYATLPDYVTGEFAKWDTRLGGISPDYRDQCRVWVALAAANVATLSVMCFLLLRDIHRNASVHTPLLFMKMLSALLFTVWWMAIPQARFLLLAAAGDYATGWGIWHFARAAWAERRERGDAGAVSLIALGA